jgi:hypothetical protein
VTRRASRVEVEDSFEAVQAYFRARRWSDGLPIVPPTEARVAGMLDGAPGDPGQVIGRVPPSWHDLTLEKLAANAVMAGCEPAYLPVLVAAFEALCDPAFNLFAIQATTHPAAPLLIVSGPIVGAIGLNAGSGVFGPGWQANATIGRAVRLVLMNVGGAWPGDGDMATHGQPGKYSYCLAENEALSPWEPLHVERGFARDQSVVTVLAAEGPHNVNDHVSEAAGPLLTIVAHTMAALGSNAKWVLEDSSFVVVLGPEHAATIARDGFTRADVKRFLYETARLPLRELMLGGMWRMHDWPRWMRAVTDADARLPIVPDPEAILLVVAGGPGKHSAVVPNFSVGRAVSRRIELAARA